MRRLLLSVTAALVLLIAALALLTGSDRSSSMTAGGYRAGTLVAYGEGASSNPDTGRLGDGVALATIASADATKTWGSPRWIVPLDAAWLTGRRLLADDARGNAWVLAMRDNRFAPVRRLRPLWPRSYGPEAVSRDGRHVAATRARRQGGGYAPSSTIAVSDLDGRNRRTFSAGLVIGWSTHGEVAAAQASGDVLLVDARTGRPRVLLSAKRANRRLRARAVVPEQAAWSADGRFAAIRVRLTYLRRPHHRRGSTIVLVDTTRPRAVRVLALRYDISLFAWAPRGDRFAYTTSGFPAPTSCGSPKGQGARRAACSRPVSATSTGLPGHPTRPRSSSTMSSPRPGDSSASTAHHRARSRGWAAGRCGAAHQRPPSGAKRPDIVALSRCQVPGAQDGGCWQRARAQTAHRRARCGLAAAPPPADARRHRSTR
jgi:hypothetical protein